MVLWINEIPNLSVKLNFQVQLAGHMPIEDLSVNLVLFMLCVMPQLARHSACMMEF